MYDGGVLRAGYVVFDVLFRKDEVRATLVFQYVMYEPSGIGTDLFLGQAVFLGLEGPMPTLDGFGGSHRFPNVDGGNDIQTGEPRDSLRVIQRQPVGNPRDFDPED
jgi:hypothetical protein